MKITIEVIPEALGPNKYCVVGLRPDRTEYFRFDGFRSSSAAEQKAADHLRRTNPKVTIDWELLSGPEKVGEALYRSSVFVPGDSE